MRQARPNFVSLPDALGQRAARTPDRTAYIFLAEGGQEQDHLTYMALDARAREIAAALARTCEPGDRALLLYPPGLDFVAGFFGCLYAGVIAVPAYPPRSPRMMPRLLAILADAQPAVALAPSAVLQRVRGWLARTPDAVALPWLATDELEPAPAGWEPAAPEGDAVAFLQYTSGSTSTPKGVMVTHDNLAHNQRVIETACGHSEESVFVSWLPLYHDLGLIGNLLQATWVGAPCVLMSPVAFLQSPVRWLRAVSRYRATTSGGPNFAFDLCVRKVLAADREQLDLSSWRVAFNGAEPVREETLARFTETFARCGFRASALYPCYGLAEATLMVSGGRPGREPIVREISTRRLVGCGGILLDLEAAVVDPESGIPCPPGGMGEIWVAGGSVARGYWNRPEETAHAFGARLPDGSGPWLRTGDLGVLSDGELFIAGRLKDLIILRGKNHYPQDLEATAERSHPALAGGSGAAFAVDVEGEERLVLVHEVERHAAATGEIAAAVRQAIAAEYEAVVQEVVLVPLGGVPRTTSGKVQRRACRDLYLNNELRALSRSRLSAAETAEPEAALPGSEGWLRHAFAAAARIDPGAIDPDRPLTAFGLDSLTAIDWRHAVEAATGVSLPIAELLDGMTLAEAARHVAEGMEASRDEPVESREPEAGDLPLSWGQRSLWFLHRLAPESVAYNLAVAAHLEGDLEVDTLQRALQALVDRHASLRTLYAAGPDGPVQRIIGRAEVAFLRENASGWSAERLRSRLQEEAFRPFDLERGPIFRAALFEEGSERRLVLAAHHIAADFWSFGIVAQELGRLCAAGGDPETAGLPALRARYTDFIRWQEELLAGPRGEELQRGWRERLAGAPPLDLPADRPQPAVSSGRGTTRAARLSAERLAGLRAFAGEHGATLFMALAAGLQALLARHSGQEDFLLGAPTSGRETGRWAGVVGYFVNPVALRADLTGDPAGEQLLARVRRAALEAFDGADFPFALLPERLQPRAMLTLQKATAPELVPLAAFALGEAGARLPLGRLKLESLALESPAAQRDLTLTAAEMDGGLALSLQLDADLFEPATADRMLGHLGQLLASLATEPQRPLSAIDLLTAPERRQILDEWSGPGTRFPEETPLHRLFADRAARSPEAVAVSCEGRSLTYGELDARTNRLARRLRRLGVGPEVRVGLCAERSPGLVEGLLAILKAGGAYVPLDPRAPAARLADLAADSGLRVVLAQEEVEAGFPPSVTVARLGEGAEESAAPVEDLAVAENAAYVIYTSGSTGRPKGVIVSHARVARLLAATEPWFGFHAGDVWTLFHSFAFDFSVWEIWGALAYGGRLVVVPYEVSRSPEAFYELLATEGVTILNQTPSAFRQLLAAEGSRREPRELALRWIIFGGEALEPAVLRPWFERRASGAGPRLANMYGITETTVHVTFRPVLATDVSSPASLVGVPIPDLRIYLLDWHGEPVPALVAGEIHVGGDGLARGYLGRPDLTAERFVPDPWSGRPGARLYRSGDLARWRPDGDLEYLGRIDHQVKIRGFRIEPGEIQAALASHPGVREAVVLAIEETGERRLAGWVVPAEDASLSVVELRRFLRERLPDYMVPLDFAFLDALPLTTNGKVDRRALLARTVVRTERDGSYQPPRNPVEEVLAGIWADLLRAERVGVEDDFFELGGHSLLAAQLVARLRELFGIELPLASLFAHPTLAALAGEIERARGTGVEASPLVPVSRAGDLPLSFAQERLWFLDRLAPSLPLYAMPVTLRMAGELDAAALAHALGEIARRHETLRTVFPERAGCPFQEVHPEGLALARIDLSALSAQAREREARNLAGCEARRPFDLARGPLARAALLRLEPEEHRLILSFHHTVADGWSVGVFASELAALYEAFSRRLPSPLPEPPVRYADFAAWQREQLDGEAMAAELSWWREILAGAPAALDLPTDRPRPAVQSFRGAVEPVELPDGAELSALARRSGATLFMTLLCGFAALVHRYTGQTDLVLGSVFAGRSRPEIQDLIGLFVNALPLRVDLTGDPGFAALLARVRAAALGAYAHQDFPLERLVQEIQPQRDLSRSPLFQVVFVLQGEGLETLRLPGVETSPEPLHTGTAKFDLTLSLAVSGGWLHGEIEFASDLFDPATARRLLAHLENLLRAAVAEPERPVSQLAMLSEAERRHLLTAWNPSAEALPEITPLHRRFTAAAARRPMAPAVSCGDLTVTYSELERRASQLARHLRGLGVGPEERVGLWLERSVEAVAGLLGIQKAGGAYVPLDPEAPAERIAFALEDAGCRVLVSEESLAGRLPSPPPAVRLVLLDRDREAISLETPEDPGVDLPAEAATYVIYTSGSTGRPKGVVVTHANAARLFDATRRWVELGPEDVTPLFHSLAFDFSVWELWGALAHGGRLVVVPAATARSAEALLGLLARERVTVLNQTPSAFRQLVQADGDAAARGEAPDLALRLVIFGGEALEPSSLAPWLARRGDGAPRLVNMYGITETTVHVTWRPLSAADTAAGARSVIGEPIKDLRVHLLDRHLEPVPLLVPGEIHVGGAGLARGYLNCPELTAERFIADPFGPPGSRLYRSGDLARRLPDGDLEYLGRIDTQVKIRGFRIELGEIEAALASHPGMREAVVVARETAGGDRHLVAYVIPEGAHLTAPALRSHLGERLPAYMVPAAFVWMDRFPLTVNGKLDRRALPEPGDVRPETGADYQAPRGPAEELIAGVWADLLGLERVGARDDFFALGGHSLLAAQAVSRLRGPLGVDLPLAALFESPTVAGLAAAAERARALPSPREAPPLQRVARREDPPLSFAQERLWFLSRLDPDDPAYNITAAVRLRGDTSAAALGAALTAVAGRHEILRTTFRETGGCPRQVIAPPATVPLPVVDLSTLPATQGEEEALRLAREEARRPCDLEQGPLARAALARHGAGEALLLLTLHHIVADGWSLGVLLRELAICYGAAREGAEARLPPLPLQFADYAIWQRGWLAGEALTGRLDGWRERLAGAPPVLELPGDRPRPPVRSSRGGSVPVSLGEETARALRALSRRNGATLFMTLFAAFETLLLRLGGGEDLLIGTPVAGRDRLETEGLIGLFVNTVVLRGNLSGDPSFDTLLARVRGATLSAFSGQDLPFEKLVEELAPERSLSHAPLVQATFALQNAPLGPLELPGLSLEPLGFDRGIAQLDLSLTLAEERGGLQGDLEYSADLFDRATVESLARQLRTLAQGIGAHPEARLSELPLLSPAERRQLVVELNGPPEPPGGRLLAQLFAEQAARSPEAIALIGPGGESLTYRELDGRTERLARRLGRTGVGPDMPVGVFLERSVELVVALLGVWKAGGVFLPLDSGLPAERLAYLLEDSGAPVLLTVRGLAGLLPATEAEVLPLDLAGPEEDTAGEPSGADEASLAWILYTSGSTGRPKPVGIPYGAAAEHLVAVGALWELGPDDRVLQFASPGFDVWMEDTVPALLRGAAVVIRGRDLWEPASLLSRTAELGISVLNLPTAYWHQWVRACAETELPPGLSVRLVVIGGEAMPPEAARLWFRTQLAGLRLLDGYGPTEGVVTAAFREVTEETAGTPRLGRPPAGRSAYVLDPRGVLLPLGGRGELCLGGPLLARGYPGRPDLTAERFVPDPFGPEWGGKPGGRLYRTGDLVRRQADGDFEFLGRADHQLKIRGFRIETGEVEAALLRDPEVAGAAVLARREASGEPRLVAYVVPAPGAEPTAAALRERLAPSLPDYMMPSAFVRLDALPVTPNGKVDRRALEHIKPEAGAAENPPALAGPAGELLASLWEELLGVRARLGDSFFEIGGHSLLATQLVSRMRQRLGVEIEVRQVFERPTLGALAGLVEERLRTGATPEPPLGPRSGEGPLPLSYAQSRLWFLDRLEPGSPLYNLPAVLLLAGPLSVPALASALVEVTLRHEALRTVFAVAGGEPAQHILSGVPPGLRPLAVADLSALPRALRQAEAERLSRLEAERPFDLSRGPLLRAALLRLDAEEHRLLLVLHHVVADGWSLGVLARELGALYRAARTGEAPRLPALPVQYADLALWQRRWLEGGELERQLAFWRTRLAGAPAALELPADRPRPRARTSRGDVERLVFPPGIAESLSALGRQSGATLFMTLLAAFQAFLGRICGTDDVVIGTPEANRDRAETEGLIGFFVNLLPLRLDLSGDPGFPQLLARVREGVLAAHAHRALPFERLVEELSPQRDPSRLPIVQVVLSVQNAPDAPLDLGSGLTAGLSEVHTGTAKFDLALHVERSGDGLAGGAEYSRDLFDAASVRNLLGSYRVLLEGLAARPESRLSELPLLSPEEREQVLVDWNRTAAAYPRDTPVHRLVLRLAESAPERVAIEDGDLQITYGELARRAGRLAACLRSLGAGPESRVGFCLERTADLGVAMLGILAAGAAYVPLDPRYPQERLAFMAEDAAIAAVITEERLLPKLPTGLPERGIPVLYLAEATARAGDWHWEDVAGDGLAYVLYTSGSTGRPKGVGVPQRAIVRLVLGTDYVELSPEDRIAQTSNSSFDAATFEVWGALLHGACLVGVDRDVLLSARRLAGFLRERRITTSFLTTALFQQIVHEVPDAFSTVRHLLFGGEMADPCRVREALAAGPERLLHVYGPTEVTTFTTWHPVATVREDAASVPIGRPIANTQIYVVDAALRPVPAGVPGELLAGGDGLARGYLGRPELTAERFIPSPFAGEAGEPGARLYRTGDRVLWRPDGTLEFLGRIDTQVKIRGFRIEPGEVEAVLAGHPGVRDAAVLAVEAGGERRLVAWVAGRDPGTPESGELRSWLERRLPAYMVPAHFVLLDALPLTPNGKVDRRALPELAASAEEPPGKRTEAPRNAVEEILAGAMAALLRRESLGIQDDFFELGGHSLLAARFVSRVRELLGVDIELRSVFEAPTVAELALRVEEARRGGDADPAPPLARREAEADPPPLSFAQQGLWFLDRLEPGLAAYNVPILLDLSGPLAPAALASALRELERRHEALRTAFAITDGEPVQVVGSPRVLPLPVVDLAALPAPARQPEAELLSEEEARSPFDLGQGPLLRTALLRLDAEEHRLLLTGHHAVVDGWSVEIVIRELSTLLAAALSGAPSPLPEPPLQYADFAVWQRRWLSGAPLETLLAHWRGRLAGAPEVLALPADRPRPAVQSHRGAVAPLMVAASQAAALGTLSRQAGATMFMTLLAAFEVLLHRYTGEEDLLVGSPVAGRGRAELFGVVGLFVNTLALRGDLAGDPGFLALLARTRETALDAYAHQDLPFERLVEELTPERDLSRNALVQVFFLLQNDPALPGELAPGLRLRVGEAGEGTAKFDLKLALAETAGELAGGFEYATDLFDAVTVERMAGHFRTLLEGIAMAPEARLSELPLLTGDEIRQLLGGGTEDRPVARLVTEWFAEHAARTPEAPAVISGRLSLSYRELDRRANRLAHRLRDAGVGPDILVALCLERSPDLVVAILAAFKAGGAYLPLDPDLPAARRLALLGDSGARVLVTREELAPDFAGAGVAALVPDPGESQEGPSPLAGPGNLAYVLYTSGSTGRPKGVMVEHRQLASYVSGVLARLELPEGARYAVISTFAADLGNTVVFAALTTGGSLHVLSSGEAADADRMAEAMERHPADCLKIVPSHLAAFLAAERPERVLPRKLLVVGGEPLSWELVDRVRELAPECRVLNHYGPTETTVGVLTCPTASTDRGRGPGVPLGRPLAGVRAAVFDSRLRPVPPGLPGELLVGGPQVSRGYLGRPDLTAERFVPDPAGAPGERVYRTGDLVRLRPEGDFVFLGRIDQQVKIRGFRVEPGEVQSALLAHPVVREALVMGRLSPEGEMRLVGYIVPRGEAPAGLERELRAWLGGRLPDAMVPSALVLLDGFPLTPNGKVDRRALPEPAPAVAPEAVALRTATEELLASLFADLLGLDRVGAEDGFFELGGHSLLATRLVARTRQVFGVDLELRALFEQPTVRALASKIDELRRSGKGTAGPPLGPRERPDNLPLSFAQERLWFLEQLDPGSAVYNVPRVFRLEGELSVGAFAAALSEIARRHEAVRTTFGLVGGVPVQRVAPAAPIPVPLVDLSALPGWGREREARRLAGEEADRPFDLGRGPLLRAVLLRREREEHMALITMHHLASDGWSVGVLVREITALYGAFAAARPSPLPELPLQYADFALWQRERLGGGTLAAEIAWWKDRLAGAPEALDLPADRPRPPVRSTGGGELPVVLDAETSRALGRLVRRRGATLFMGLLAGFQALLGRYTGQEDLLVGTPVANRNRAEVEDLIGFFVNTLVLRADVSGDPSFAVFLDRVREQALAAYDHQDLPFERLVEELRPERSLSRPPLVQVTIALQNAPVPPPALPGLRLTPLPGGNRTSKFDLSLVFEESGDRISGAIEYSTDLFDAATVARLAGHLGVLLATATAAPENRLSALSLLTEAERIELRAANDTGNAGPAGCVHELFEAQAALTPGAVALIHGTERWTYGELDLRANVLARRLVRMGVGPEIPVAVCLERTADLPAALLAVLKAGGAYVPLDPTIPRERLAFVLADSRAAVLLTRGGLATGLSAEVPTLDLDTVEPGEPGSGRPSSGVSPAHLAYVIYTSGSTGRPKGVAIEHRNAAALIHWARATFSVEELTGVLAATSAGFDLSVFEMFVPLATGGAVILATNALELPHLPAAGEVTLVNTVPSAIAELARQGGIPPSVRTVNLAGEPLKAALAREVSASSRAERIWNLYGPTEDTTYSTAALVGREDAREPAIGRPLPGTRAYVLDRSGQEAPVSVPGELCLAGTGLARGYLGRPDLTADRFGPDPFSAVSGARLYRTGDLVRRRPGGDLEYLGRLDHQVKIRGVRVELGEVESVLAAHPTVREAMALVREDGGERRLVAWVAPAAGAACDQAILREHLRARLPEAMVPSAFVILERLPLTPNGKIDRKALPAPDWMPAVAYTAPRNQVEEILTGLWSEILRVDRVGVHDNFFDLGGHSLLGIRLLSQVRDLFGVALEVRSLFEQPTVAGMAVAIGQELVALADEESLAEIWAEVEDEELAERNSDG